MLSVTHGVVLLIAAWTTLGIGMGMGLYEAAFATLARIYGSGARKSITGITLGPGGQVLRLMRPVARRARPAGCWCSSCSRSASRWVRSRCFGRGRLIRSANYREHDASHECDSTRLRTRTLAGSTRAGVVAISGSSGGSIAGWIASASRIHLGQRSKSNPEVAGGADLMTAAGGSDSLVMAFLLRHEKTRAGLLRAGVTNSR